MLYGEPDIDTKISLYIVIISFFIAAIVISTLIITIAKKWSVINFSKVLKSNSILYGTLIFVYIMSYMFSIHIGAFSRKNDLVEKIIYLLFFLILFVLQSVFILKYFYRNTKDSFLKGYKLLILFLYLVSLIYILINFFPDDASDKYLTHSKTYIYLPTENTKTLLDNSILKIDSAISTFDYYSNKDNIEKDLTFTIYFNSRHKEQVPFSFRALDSINEFGASNNERVCKKIYLKKLNDSIKIILEEVNFKKNIGWDNPKNTDTILFVKTKTKITKPR